MNKTNTQQIDNILGNSSALDSVLVGFDFASALYLDRTCETSNAELARNSEGPAASKSKTEFISRQRRLPWLGR